LYPLLWLHGAPQETEAEIRREIQAMSDAGCGGFIIESRPHADYLGEGWWHDVAFCLNEAHRRGMEVWIFDEEFFPSGIAGGKVLQNMPAYRMQVLTRKRMEWSTDQEANDEIDFGFDEVLKVICIREGTDEAVILTEPDLLGAWMNDLRESAEGVLERWSIQLIGLMPSWDGRMFDKMVDYLCPEVTDCFISLTYEETKSRFPEYWGTTIKGFFGDETSFENIGSYDVLFGEETPCFPWSRSLRQAFVAAKGYDLVDCLELLWQDDAHRSSIVRVDFMDVMTTLFADNFFGRIQRWCHSNGVQYIGHIVEDNHAHMHHGYGVGHFFRTTKHFDMGGYDLVLRQMDSEQKRSADEERFPRFKHYREEPYPDFYHYTLAKLAQSAAHLEVGTSLVMCENFGAYGWDLGLREMKWITDWMTARGTNWYVPHAFSPIFPDPDCPPHFYAGGRNPQWPYFRQWGNYANRSCLLLREADHVASLAVLYPAESHWAGDQDLLDGVCKKLMQHQYDFDILSMDLFADEQRCTIDAGALNIRGERFEAILLPGIQSLPSVVRERLKVFVEAGGRVISVGCAAVEGGEAVELPKIADYLLESLTPGIVLTRSYPELRFCHYRKADCDIFFLNNESMSEVFEDLVGFPVGGVPERWSPMTGATEKLPLFDRSEGRVDVPVRLEPYEAYFYVFQPETVEDAGALTTRDVLPEDWHRVGRAGDGSIYRRIPISTRTIEHWRAVQIDTPLSYETVAPPEAIPGIGDWNGIREMDKFSGSVVYETMIDVESSADDHLLDLGEVGEIASVEVNGHQLMPRFCPPYRWELRAELLKPRGNILRVTVTNTLGSYFTNNYYQRDIPAPAGLIGPVTVAASRRSGM